MKSSAPHLLVHHDSMPRARASRMLFGTAILVALLLAGCASSGASPTAPADAVTSEPWFDEGVHVADGRELNASCYGTGGPAVIYLHGLIQPTDSAVWAHAPEMQDRLGAETTYCEYERTNVGGSRVQNGPIPVSQSVDDLHALIRAIDLELPVVLLGGSFGGLIAYTYTGTYPEDVAGVVLLDPTLHDELAIDAMMPESWRLTEDAWQDNAEQIDTYGAYAIAQAALPGIPDVPGTVFVTEKLEAPPGVDGEAFVQAIRGQQLMLIGQFEPGQTITVDVPHAMMAVVPDHIADAVLEIVAAAR